MKRINEMFPLMVVLLTTMLTGCPMGSPPPPSTGACTEEGDSQLCTTAGGCNGIQICGRGGSSPDLHWSMCTGPSGTCTPGMDAGPGPDTGMIADAGMPDDAGASPTDGGMTGTDAGMSGSDAGPTCDPTIVRTCTGACGVPGATGFLVDSCDPTSPCVDDLTDPTGGCTTVPTPFCPCTGAACSLITACITPCDFAGVQTVQDYCRGDACYPVFPESCMSTTDAGMMSVDAGMDAGPPPVIDAGSDAGSCGCTVDDCTDMCGNLGLYLCVGGVRSTTCTPYMTMSGGPTTTVGTGDACRPGRTPLPCSGGLVLFDDSTGAYNTSCTSFTTPGLCGPDAGTPDAGMDAGPPPMDAGSDAGPGMTDAGAGVDAGSDAGMDAGSDGGMSMADAGSDAGSTMDAGSDAGMSVDAGPPPGVTGSGYYLVLSAAAQARCGPSGFLGRAFCSLGEPHDSASLGALVHIPRAGHLATYGTIPATAICSPLGDDRFYFGLTDAERLALLGRRVTDWDPGATVWLDGVNVTANSFFCWDEAHRDYMTSIGAPRSSWNPDYVRISTSLDTPLTGCRPGTGP